MLKVLLVAPRVAAEARTGRAVAFSRLADQIAGHARIQWVAGYRTSRSVLPDGALGVDLRGERQRGGWLRLWRGARQLASSSAPDVVVTSGLGLPPLGVPQVAVVRDLVGRGWERSAGGLWVRLAGQAPAAVVVPTQAVRRAVSGLGIGRWRIRRLSVGVQVPGEPVPLPASDGTLRIVHAGTIHPAKGQHVSIDAISRLPVSLKRRVHLTITGAVADPRYHAQLRIAAADQPITLRPEVADLRAELARAHLVLYPTALPEGFPDVAVEALAVGRAVVWPDAAPLREALGGAGIAVAHADVPSVRDAIAAALTSLELGALGRAGHAVALQRHSWRALWPRWRALLVDTASRG